jgi:hypothetical protein
MRNRKMAMAVTSIVAVASMGFTASASASKGGGHNALPPRDVAWTMDSVACSLLPGGTVLTATGVLTPKFKSKSVNGVTTETFDDHAEGTATDQDGNTYTWSYDNALRIRNSAHSTTLFSGDMTDKFRLWGGPIELANGFDATYVEDRGAGTFGIYPRSSYGDPFGFPNIGGHCDPL